MADPRPEDFGAVAVTAPTIRPEDYGAVAVGDNQASPPPAVAAAPKPTPLTNDNPNPIDAYLIRALEKNPQIANMIERTAGQGTKFGRFVQGMADLPVGAMQFAVNAVGSPELLNRPEAVNAVNREVGAIRGRTEALRGDNANTFDWWRLGGAMANPVPWKAAGALPQTASTVGRIGQAGLLSTLIGGPGQPVTKGEYFPEMATNATISGVTGMAIPGVWELGKGIGTLGRNIFGPMTESGAKSAAGRLAREVAGDKVDDVVTNLQTANRNVNAGQAAVPAGSAEFSALQRIADQAAPSEAVALKAAQEARRAAALGHIAKDDAAMATAEGVRSAVTKPLYAAATGQKGPINVVPVVSKIDDLLTNNPGNRELVNELNNIRDGVAKSAKDFGFGPSFTNADAQKVSSVIDGIKSAIAKKENTYIKTELLRLKELLVSSVPGYEKAQAEFARLSGPINRMQVGQELTKKLASAIGEKPGTYLNTLNESAQILKKATGQNRFDDLADILTPREMKLAKSVATQLENELKMRTLANAGMKKTGKTIGEMSDSFPQVAWLNRIATAINAVSRRIESGASQRTTEELAKMMSNPREMARIMINAKPAERSIIIDGLVKAGAISAGPVVGQQQQEQ